MQEKESARPRGWSHRATAVALALAALVVVGYFAVGMPGMEHSAGRTGEMAHPAGAPVAVTPRAFTGRSRDPAVFLVDVHVPGEGRLDGTDATIPYDRIVGDPGLPPAKDTPILLYCRTGWMSESAGRELLRAGYTDVSHLEGGTGALGRAGLAPPRRA